MVERVARAMVLSWGGDPDTTETASSALPGPKMWELYADQARAAIAAMREPTAMMIDAGWASAHNEDAADTWRDMIDAALADNNT